MMIILRKNLAFDTNIWIYFLDKGSPYHLLADKVFTQAEKEKTTIIVAHQNILELIRVLTKGYKFSLKEAVHKAQSILKYKNVKVIQPSFLTLSSYFDLCRTCKKAKNHFDLYLAATLLDNDVEALVTNDKSGFAGIKKLQVFSLAELSL